MLGRGAGAFPLTLTAIQFPNTVIDTPVALAHANVTLTFAPTVTFATDQYVDVESSAFDIAGGDIIVFTLARAAATAGPTVQVIRQSGIVE